MFMMNQVSTKASQMPLVLYISITLIKFTMNQIHTGILLNQGILKLEKHLLTIF